MSCQGKGGCCLLSRSDSTTLRVMAMQNGPIVIQDEDEEDQRQWPDWLKYLLGISGFVLCAFIFTWSVMAARVPEIEPLSRVASLSDRMKLLEPNNGRIILIGDVHGMYKELQELLHNVDYQSGVDRLVFLGDMITKGPDSIKVIEYAIEEGAYCVRGNHEDEILSMYASKHHINAPKTYPPHASIETKIVGDVQATSVLLSEPTTPASPLLPEANNARDKPLVRKLKPHHIRYIEQCPTILKLGQVSKKGIEAVAVHGGLMWDEHDLELQDPEMVMRIRSVGGKHYHNPSEEDDGTAWFILWNDEQHTRPKDERYEIYYGHDASKGLQLHRYTKGLDSRCQRGDRLSGYTVTMDEEGHYHEDLVQVDC